MSLRNIFTRTKTILLVEDDTTLRRALAERFKQKGYKTVEAGDAKSVLTLMTSAKPDALVLDLILPLKDGISLLEELRQTGYILPVVILSNLLGSEDLRGDAERLDAVFYNKSSVSLDDIVNVVEKRL